MTYAGGIDSTRRAEISPLVLCDRFLRLAEDADRAGFRIAAEHLIYLADQVLDHPQSLTVGTFPAASREENRPDDFLNQ